MIAWALVPEPEAKIAMRTMARSCDLRRIMENNAIQKPLDFQRYGDAEMRTRAKDFRAELARRRTVRHFSDAPVPFAVVEEVVRAAGTAPSGAHKQPWTFCVVGDPVLKKQIRVGAEAEEELNYAGRMSDEWIEDLKPFGTDRHKPFLEIAPWLVVVFRRPYELEPDGRKHPNYYVNESVGIATGMLLAAAHHAGLATLTHTPSPMDFLSKLLGRPSNERPYLLVPMGLPAENALVPNLERKPVEQILIPYI